jgi:hypothetical protein
MSIMGIRKQVGSCQRPSVMEEDRTESQVYSGLKRWRKKRRSVDAFASASGLLAVSVQNCRVYLLLLLGAD